MTSESPALAPELCPRMTEAQGHVHHVVDVRRVALCWRHLDRGITDFAPLGRLQRMIEYMTETDRGRRERRDVRKRAGG